MPFANSFCNSPWFELHIYWDGSLAYCCAQTPYKPYPEKDNKKYNIQTTSIKEFYNSQPMKEQRLSFGLETKNTACETCWHVEDSGMFSRRYRANQKSVIFQIENFKESYKQSPHNSIFEKSFSDNGNYNGLPIDLHIDLGNHCNLACKMCNPYASTKIAAQEIKWGILDDTRTVSVNWTKDEKVWKKFTDELLSIPNLKNVHFMGGETLLSPRLKELVKLFDKEKRYEVCFSFVTNGTIFDKELIYILSKFGRVGIEISVETNSIHNEYIRQGSSNKQTFGNIKKFVEASNFKNVTVTLRPALGALSIGNYHTLIEYAIENKLLIKTNPMTHPSYLVTTVLPKTIRKEYKQNLIDLKNKYSLSDDMLNKDFNITAVENYELVALQEINKTLYDLDREDCRNQEKLLKDFTDHLKRWDSVYNLNAYDHYPELADILKSNGY